MLSCIMPGIDGKRFASTALSSVPESLACARMLGSVSFYNPFY